MTFTSQVWLQRISDDVYKSGVVTEECLSPRPGQDTMEKCHQELAAVFTPELALAVYIPLCRIFGRLVRSCTVRLSSLAGQSGLVSEDCRVKTIVAYQWRRVLGKVRVHELGSHLYRV